MEMMPTETKRKQQEPSPELKAQILTECDRSGASVAQVAMTHGVNAIVREYRSPHADFCECPFSGCCRDVQPQAPGLCRDHPVAAEMFGDMEVPICRAQNRFYRVAAVAAELRYAHTHRDIGQAECAAV
jgi:hypothetical protein